MSKQLSQTITAAGVEPTRTSACLHPEAVGTRWGDPINEERQAELQGYLDRWEAEADHGERRGPFDKQSGESQGVPLNAADVAWLAARAHIYSGGYSPDLHLEGANIYGAHLELAVLGESHLEGANFYDAHLERAYLQGAHLEGAYLDSAHLSEARLHDAHLEGAFLRNAHLEGADLRRAWLDSRTMLIDTTLDTRTRLGDIQWNGIGGVNLTRIDWSHVRNLGDEQDVELGADERAHEGVVRAYRQLATQLHAQGMNEVADRFTYRAQICQRQVLRRRGRRHFPAYLGSLLLDTLSGYGYKLWRILAAYGVVLVVFSLVYWRLGIHSFSGESGIQALWDSFLVSLAAIHGRTTFEQLGAWSPAAWVAAVESVFGIVIEGVFVAMLIQRFFGR